MASDTKNVKLGVCQIFHDNVDMGYTMGGVEVAVTTETHKTNIDQFGKTVVNEFIEGRNINVKAPLAETTLRNMAKTMPGAELVTDGRQASGELTFTGQPAAASTVTIAGQAFTFQVGNPANVFQVKIGANTAETVANLAAAVNLSQIALSLGGLTATALASVLKVTATDTGTAQNAIAVAAAAPSNGTWGAATLTGGVETTRARVDVKTGIGIDLLAAAKVLRLHPIAKPANDLSEDLIVFRAATAGAMNFAYKVDSERVFNTEFNGYPDPATQKLFSYGDPLAV